jgi:hypothetical protein
MALTTETYCLLWQTGDLRSVLQGTHGYVPGGLLLQHYLQQLPLVLYYSRGEQHKYVASVFFTRSN